MPGGMMEKTSESQPRRKTRIASISFTRWRSGADLKKLRPPHPQGAAAG
jgi:hypothetical protein